ncbi:tenascin-R [Elysia marginata]|uniref:Tenascin-R n=1 Tax=Elysia marginata TaxID=1093978 RepID=A0AAV4G1V3_9GAST|nr:tenascin-R [Elysia marginata]
MGKYGIIICLLSSISSIKCLEMHLELNTPTLVGHRFVCGVLTCQENIGSIKNGSSENDFSQSTISSMSIYKTTQDGTGENDSSGTMNLLATLTQSEPSVLQVSDGIKIDGKLETGRASLSLKMFKTESCASLYSCEVRISDGQGREFVQTNRLRQQRYSQTMGRQYGGDVKSLTSLQQMALLHQQVTLMGASIERQLGAFDAKLENLDDKVKALDARLGLGQGHFEDRHLAVQSDIEALKDEVKDQIESRVVDKLSRLESKLPSVERTMVAVVSTAWGKIEEILEGFREKQRETGVLNSEAISNRTNEMVSKLRERVAEKFALEQRGWKEKFESYTKTLQAAVYNISNDVSSSVKIEISSIKNDIGNDFEYLKRSLRNSSRQTCSSVDDQVRASTTFEISNALKPVLAEILSPTDCIKGMISMPSGARYPYPVIQPSADSGLNDPYLCDTITDGGGWIIIQRRTTGNVNFYRNWDAYKIGFGRLGDDIWLGNSKIHTLTNSGKGQFELRIEISNKGKYAFAHYNSFLLESEENGYKLKLGRYDGTATDMLSYHRNQPFSTYDRDNDGHPSNCAVGAGGAWWYKGCYHSNLNGNWNTYGDRGMLWVDFSSKESVTFSEMKIRRL